MAISRYPHNALAYAAAAEYHRTHGNLDVPANYVNADGLRLGTWLANLRARRKKGRARLTEKQICRLDELGMLWRGKHELEWERAFLAAERCRKRMGDLDIPRSYQTENGFRLGRRALRQRELQKAGGLSEDRRQRLDELGMIWTKKSRTAKPRQEAAYGRAGHGEASDDRFGLYTY